MLRLIKSWVKRRKHKTLEKELLSEHECKEFLNLCAPEMADIVGDLDDVLYKLGHIRYNYKKYINSCDNYTYQFATMMCYIDRVCTVAQKISNDFKCVNAVQSAQLDEEDDVYAGR
ncbi:MAG TPA: hypothetical protein VNU45_19150 [Rummeliibacillus sp.]|nr:hypothetical protein [Rummeliibacillus sp.]